MVTAVRKILNTGTNKFENAVNQMTELIYSGKVYNPPFLASSYDLSVLD